MRPRLCTVSCSALVTRNSQVSERALVPGCGATYPEPNKTVPELRQMVANWLIDPLREFSEPSCGSGALNFGPPE